MHVRITIYWMIYRWHVCSLFVLLSLTYCTWRTLAYFDAARLGTTDEATGENTRKTTSCAGLQIRSFVFHLARRLVDSGNIERPFEDDHPNCCDTLRLRATAFDHMRGSSLPISSHELNRAARTVNSLAKVSHDLRQEA